jgi:hypothetical protein
MADRAADPPHPQVIGRRAEGENRGLVERDDRVEAELKELVDVAQVADDLGGGPALWLRALAQRGGRDVRDHPRDVGRHALEAIQEPFDVGRHATIVTAWPRRRQSIVVIETIRPPGPPPGSR